MDARPVVKRICEYLEYKGITRYKAEVMCGLTKNYLGQTKNPTSEYLLSILAKFPDLSAEWLLRGEGSMIRSTKMQKNVPAKQPQEDFGALMRLLNRTAQENEVLRAENAALRDKKGNVAV